MKDNLIILGAGGHARVVADALLASGRRVLGFIDANPNTHGTHLLGLPVLGGDDVLETVSSSDTELANGIGSAGTMDARQRVYQTAVERGFSIATVVHPAAIVAATARLEQGAQVMARAVIQPMAVVGTNSIVNTGAIIEHDVVIGAHVHISPGCVLAGEVRVQDLVHVGVGSIIIQRVNIGTHSLVAAGAVVVSDVEAGSKVMGIPARARS